MLSQVRTKLRCSAEKFKWLWAIRGMIEKIMLKECKIVAEKFVDYCRRVARDGVEKTVSCIICTGMGVLCSSGV